MEKSHCWIFLSHSSVDIEKVRMIRNEFEACGHNPLAFYLKCLNDSTQKMQKSYGISFTGKLTAGIGLFFVNLKLPGIAQTYPGSVLILLRMARNLYGH